jgi:hypothetical protein
MNVTPEVFDVVYDHAIRHYGVNGWDYFVECWQVIDLQDVADKTAVNDVESLIDAVGKLLYILAEVEADIQGA